MGGLDFVLSSKNLSLEAIDLSVAETVALVLWDAPRSPLCFTPIGRRIGPYREPQVATPVPVRRDCGDG
jgi:hypothetical protein